MAELKGALSLLPDFTEGKIEAQGGQRAKLRNFTRMVVEEETAVWEQGEGKELRTMVCGSLSIKWRHKNWWGDHSL
jgi:hypothetical protein